MIGVGQADLLAHLGDVARRAEQEFSRLLQLTSNHVPLGGNTQMATKQFQDMRTAPSDDRR